MKKNITIVGGGNVGTQLAVHCAEKKHNVTVYTSRPKEFKTTLFAVDENGATIRSGEIQKATSDAKEAFADADIIFVTVPANHMERVARKIEPFVEVGTKIGIVPGVGGSEFVFSECRSKGGIVFGLQRVPSVARIVTYGQSVCVAGYRKELSVAAVDEADTEECCELVSELLEMPCVGLPNYLNILLLPSNPILHTTRLSVLFKDYKRGITYDYNPLFYEEWNDESSQLLLACDEELQKICSRFKLFDLSHVASLKKHYESKNAKELTNKLKSIKSLKGLRSPVIKAGDKYIPDFLSRYFLSDFPFGLSILIQVAKLVGVKVPVMTKVYEWFEELNIECSKFEFAKYKINNYEDLKNFYLLKGMDKG